jgi:hypothetical protein
MADVETEKPSAGAQIFNGVKFLADVVLLPGASQIVEGKVVPGIASAGSGLVVRCLLPGLLGPLGWLTIGLDSYAYSVSGKHLWQRSQPLVSPDHNPDRPPE